MKRLSRLFKSKRKRRENKEENSDCATADDAASSNVKSNLKNFSEHEDNTSNAKREYKKVHFDEKEEVSNTDPDSMSSEKWRKDGNKHYTTATPNLCASIVEERLKKALQCYHRAIELAANKEEYASAAKNCALAAWRLGDIAMHKREIHLMHYHHKEALKHFVKAKDAGVASMSTDWNVNLGTRLQECLQHILEAATSGVYDTRKKVLMIDAYRNEMTENHSLLPDIFLFMTDMIFRGAVVSVASGQYKDALSLLRDANFPLEEGKRFGRQRVDIVDELNVLDQDIYYQTCAAESLQACALGDELLRRAIETDETMNMDLIWDVIDWYKQGIMLTREKEVELEAMALSKLGSVYHKVLKIPHRAKDNFLRCIQLAMSLHPRTFDNDDWFTEAKRILEVYQDQIKKQEDEKYQQERAKYLEELKDEMEKLKKYENDEDLSFLKFVYVTWPPKRKDFTMEDPSKIKEYEQRKKALQKAVIHYHPDKVDVEEHGMKWKVLSEEIVKVLTRKYECYKG